MAARNIVLQDAPTLKSPPSYQTYKFVKKLKVNPGLRGRVFTTSSVEKVGSRPWGFKWRHAARLTLLFSKPIESWSAVSWLQVSDSYTLNIVEWYPALYLSIHLCFLQRFLGRYDVCASHFNKMGKTWLPVILCDMVQASPYDSMWRSVICAMV